MYVETTIIYSIYRPVYGFGWPRNRGLIPGQVSRNILCIVHTGSKIHPASCSMVTVGCFLGSKAAGA
jgi:hypothetical protein